MPTHSNAIKIMTLHNTRKATISSTGWSQNPC